MSVTLCQYTVGGLCCICTSGCLQAPTICASGGNISTNCCVVAGNICASGGNFTTNCCLAAACVYASNNICTICCIVAPIVCAQTCFIGNGSGLTNLASPVTLITNSVISGASSVAFTNLCCTTYKYYYLEMDGITTNCASTYLYVLFSNNNGSCYITCANYLTAGAEFGTGGGTGYPGAIGCTYINFMYNALYTGGAGGSTGQGNMCIYNAGSSSLNTVLAGQFSYFQANASLFVDVWTASMRCGYAVGANAICIYANVGAISGNFRLYGVN